MPNVRWKRSPVVRVLGAYRWNEGNGWMTYVRPEDALEVLTNPDFAMADGKGAQRLERLDGIDRTHLGALQEDCGVFTFEDITRADPEGLARVLGTTPGAVDKLRQLAAQRVKQED